MANRLKQAQEGSSEVDLESASDDSEDDDEKKRCDAYNHEK